MFDRIFSNTLGDALFSSSVFSSLLHPEIFWDVVKRVESNRIEVYSSFIDEVTKNKNVFPCISVLNYVNSWLCLYIYVGVFGITLALAHLILMVFNLDIFYVLFVCIVWFDCTKLSKKYHSCRLSRQYYLGSLEMGFLDLLMLSSSEQE